ncbi:hypothetical protein LPJ78_000669 [Coemansia sp. RSA 989]|nr:hypothetical protein LPJ78_000669 [Coemansia sp. RSA 989]
MANNNDRLSEDLPEHIRARFNDLLECDYCSKLYPADAGIKRWRLVYRKKLIWPVEYNFCSAHWNTEKQRIAALFAPRELACLQPYHASKQTALRQTKNKIAQQEQLHSSKTPSTIKRAIQQLFGRQISQPTSSDMDAPVWQILEDDVPNLPDLSGLCIYPAQ